MHTGIGPFDIDSGATMSYGKVDYTKKAFKLQAFMNVLDGNADQPARVDPTGKPIAFDFDTKTFDVEVGDTHDRSARKHVLTYGGNLRLNRFDLSIAPGENIRTEGGAYVQDEMLLNDQFRAGRRRARRQVQLDRQRGVLAARGARASSRSADQTFRVSLQPRVPRAVDDQQLPQTHDRARRLPLGADQSRRSAARSTACRRRPSAIRI